MKKVISIVSIIFVVAVLLIYLSNKATPQNDNELSISSAEAIPSTPENQTALASQPAETPFPPHHGESTVTLATPSEESNTTYSTKSDPNIQPIDPDTDPANQQVHLN